MADQKPSTTTVEQNLRTAGQRRVNLIWEYTQAFIANGITIVTLTADFMSAVGFVRIDTNQLVALAQLNGMALLVFGFYFGRTNHARIGDIGRTVGLDDRPS